MSCNECFFRSLDSCSHPDNYLGIQFIYCISFEDGKLPMCDKGKPREDWQYPIVDYENTKVKCNRCKKEFHMNEMVIGAKGSSWTCKTCNEFDVVTAQDIISSGMLII